MSTSKLAAELRRWADEVERWGSPQNLTNVSQYDGTKRLSDGAERCVYCGQVGPSHPHGNCTDPVRLNDGSGTQ